MKTEKNKLQTLQFIDRLRTGRDWKSLDDQRVCILCAKKFNGHEVQITCSDNGKYELRCPTNDCNSGPHQWVYPGAPLIPDIVHPVDWWDYSPKAGTQIRNRVSSCQLSETAEPGWWDYSAKAGEPLDLTTVRQRAIDRCLPKREAYSRTARTP